MGEDGDGDGGPGSGQNNAEDVPPATETAAPKKIALKVPSLFIKGALDKSVTSKKEENEVKKEDSSAKSEAVPKKPRAMPASARRKLEEKLNGLGNTSAESSAPSTAVDDSGLEKSTPLLDECNASSTVETEEETERTDTLVTSTTTSNATNSVENEKNIENKTSKPFKRPMPASARKRLEQKSSLNSTDEKEETVQNNDDDEDEDKDKGEVKDSSSTDTGGVKKIISLSLGGIKLPSFKKPVSSTEVKKASEEDEETEKSTQSCPRDDDNDSMISTASRRTARRSGAAELLSLEDPQHVCETCGASFTHAYAKKKHFERIHLGIREDKPKPKEGTEEKKQIRVCQICSRKYPNKKTYRDHVRKCRRPKKPCALCDKQFSSEKELIQHIKDHAKTNQETETDVPQRISPQSIFDSNDIIVPASPVSVVKSDDENEDDDDNKKEDSRHSSNESSHSGVSSTKSGSSKESLKRKLAQAFTNFASKKSKESRGSGGVESIQGRPMPASIKKKLEERGSSSSNTETFSHNRDKLACRVCSNRFSSVGNRLRHEKNVHSHHQEEEESQPEASCSVAEASSDVDLTKCSVCQKKFSDRFVRARHERNVHKLHVTNTTTTTLDSPAPKNEPEEEIRTAERSPVKTNPLRCSVCMKCFSSKGSKRKHERRVHSLKPKLKAKDTTLPTSNKRNCRFCGKRFSHSWKATRHERDVHIRKGNTQLPIKKPSSPNHNLGHSNRPERDDQLKTEKDEAKPPKSPKTKIISTNQCEVCFRVFSQGDNRRRHEKIAHNIFNPRPGSKQKKVVVKPKDDDDILANGNDDDDSKSEVGAVNAEAEMENDDPDLKNQKTGMEKAKELLSTLTFQGGRCPICLNFLQQQLKRHLLTVHKLRKAKDSKSESKRNPSVSSQLKLNDDKEEPKYNQEDPTIRQAKELMKTLKSKTGGRCPMCKIVFKSHLLRHIGRRHKSLLKSSSSKSIDEIARATVQVQPPTYKIYKSATDKLKKKLAPSSNSSVPAQSPVKSSGNKLSSSSSSSSQLLSPCCQTPFTLEDEYDEYKCMRQPKKKSYIACKICMNMFSHNEDFLLHMKFRHSDASCGEISAAKTSSSSSKVKASTKSSQPPKSSSASSAPTCKPSQQSPLPPSLKREDFRRSIRRDRDLSSVEPPSLEVQEPSKLKPEKRRVSFTLLPKVTNCSVTISEFDRSVADKMLQKPSRASSNKPMPKSAKKKESSKVKVPSPSPPPLASPEPMDTFDDDDHYDEPISNSYEDTAMSDDDNNDDAQVTSTTATTFTPAPTSNQTNSFGFNEMPCSTCKEVFYSFEALRKHELYFHNVKISLILCPICGVFPKEKLSIHLSDHENKTVKCDCVPCGLNFSDFGKLRKHNLEQHPDPPPKGKPLIQYVPVEIDSQQDSEVKEDVKKGNEVEPKIKKDEKKASGKEVFRCLVCKRKEFDMRMKARKHIRTAHNYIDDAPDNYIEQVEVLQEQEKEEEIELDAIVQETTNKLGGSDWDSDVDDGPAMEAERSPSPPPPPPVPKRSMPASVRMKLELAAKLKELQKSVAKKREDEESKKPEPEVKTKRAMPASVRAKLAREKEKAVHDDEDKSTPVESEAPKINEGAPKPKPSRPMPASIRAKLEREKKENAASQDVNDDPKTASDASRQETRAKEEPPKPKPSRPMPASARAKLEQAKQEKESVVVSQDGYVNPGTPSSDISQVSRLSEESVIKPKPASRPMPASMRAKLEQVKERLKNQDSNDNPRTPSDISRPESVVSKVNEEPSKPKPRAMPASIRAKLEREKRERISIIIEDEDANDNPSTPIQSDISQVSKSNEEAPKPKPIRAMPASVRAKLLAKSETNSSVDKKEEESPSVPEERPRAMPASARAKLRNKAELKEVISVLADKRNEETELSSDDDGGRNDKDDDEDYIPSGPTTPQSSPDISEDEGMEEDDDVLVTSSGEIQVPGNENQDDNDDVQVVEDKRVTSAAKVSDDDVVVLSDDEEVVAPPPPQKPEKTVEPSQPPPPPPAAQPPAEVEASSEELSEHDKAVRIAMGELTPAQAGINVKITYQCKLCSKTFDTVDSIRRHIRRGHSEYGPEHTENLIEQIYEETRTEASTEDPTRKRKRTTRYTEEEYLDAHDELEEDDEEAEVIIKRGTSSRMRKQVEVEREEDPDFHPQMQSFDSVPKERAMSSVQENVMYACRFCGKQMDSSANIKRHISKAHREDFKKGTSGVVELRPGVEPPPILNEPQKKGKDNNSKNPAPAPPTGINIREYKCRICQWRLKNYHSIYQHVRRSHPEIKNGAGYIDPIYEDGYNASEAQILSVGGDVASQGPTYSCIHCEYVTYDENEYVRHYKQHTGVSPYQCQYCAGTFNRNQQLLAHIEREHTGAEFLNEDEEEEFIMEDVTTNQIQVSTTAPIQIEQSKAKALPISFITASKKVNLQRRKSKNVEKEKSDSDSDEDDGQEKEKIICKRERNSGGHQDVTEKSASPSPPNSPVPAEMQQDEVVAPTQRNHADLSSLFFTLGGEKAPGGLEAMDDIDGGMSLD